MLTHDGRRDALCAPFSGLTRFVSEEERNGVVCEGEYGRLCVRYDGATVTSWKPVALKGREVFYMPENTPWGKEVHGGLPICWPWFGKAEGRPKHGLARYLRWRLVRRIGKNRVELETESTAETLKMWPHPFKLRAVIAIVGMELTLSVTETNTGTEPYGSAFGVHPYFAVADACSVSLDGAPLPRPWVMREFAADGKRHRLDDCVRRRSFSVSASDNDKWRVWNPGVEQTPICESLAHDEWRRFFCLEPLMEKPQTLSPGKSRTHAVRVVVGAQ
jgi:glucose-6-phosphate 1-epimerase